MRFSDRPADLRRLRPLRSLLWQALAGTLAFLVPISAVLYFLTVPHGPWQLVLAMQGLIVLAFLAAYVSYLRLGVWVGARGIAERGFFGLSMYIPVEQIGSIVLVNTFQGTSTEAVPQLFLCDERGRQLLRMRGQFWSRSSMLAVSETLDIALEQLTDDVSKAELLASHPGLLYWFERRPILVAVILTSALAVGVGLVAVIWSAV